MTGLQGQHAVICSQRPNVIVALPRQPSHEQPGSRSTRISGQRCFSVRLGSRRVLHHVAPLGTPNQERRVTARKFNRPVQLLQGGLPCPALPQDGSVMLAGLRIDAARLDGLG